MAANNTVSSLDALFKDTYAKEIPQLMPDVAVLSKEIPFKEAEKVGRKFRMPVVLSREQGVTYNIDGSAFSIVTPIAMAMDEAEVQGCEILLASRMSYNAAQKAASSKQAFKAGTQHLVENMLESISFRLESSLVHGGKSLATGASATGSSTTRAIVLTAQTFSAALWGGSENAELDVYVSTTQQNTNAAVVVTSVDIDNRTINVSGNATDLTAITTNIATCEFYFRGSYGKEMAGLRKILSNSGSLFGIDAGTYSLWRANQYAVGGAISVSHILKATAKAIARGLNEDAVCYINPDKWEVLNAAMSDLRSIDQSYDGKKGENGNESLVFHTACGKVHVKGHPLMHPSEAMILPMSKVKRIGATDVTFSPSGADKDKTFVELSSNAGFELRAYTEQAIFLEAPARAVLLTGIT